MKNKNIKPVIKSRSRKAIQPLLGSIAALLAAGVLLQAPAKAGQIWDGGGADGNWTNNLNWNLDTPPAFGTALQFGGVLQPASVNNAATASVVGITFNAGAGAFTLSGNAITLTGGITNSAGNNQTISFGTTGLTLGAGQTFDAGAVAGGALTVTSAVNLNGAGLIVTGTNNTTISGNITGAGAASTITKNGTGALTLSTVGANTFAGNLAVNDGTVNLSTTAGANNGVGGNVIVGDSIGAASSAILNNLPAGGGNIPDTSTVTVNSDGLYNSNNETIAALTVNGGTVTTAGAPGVGLTVTGLTTMTGGTISGGPTNPLFLNGNLQTNASVTTALISAPVVLGPPSTTFTVADGAAAVDLNVTGVISGGVFIKAGAGAMQLAGANTYTGATTVNAGTLQLTSTGTLGTTAAGTTVAAGATLLLLNGANTGTEAITLNGTGVASAGALAVAPGGTATVGGAITIGTTNTVISAGNGSTLNLTGGVVKNGVNVIFGNIAPGATLANSGTINISGVGISGTSGVGSFNSDVLYTTGTVNLLVPSPYLGITWLNNGGVVNVNAPGALPQLVGDLGGGGIAVTRTGVVMDADGSAFFGVGNFPTAPVGATASTGGSVLNLGVGVNQSIQFLASGPANVTPATRPTVNLGANILTIGTAAGTPGFVSPANFFGQINGTVGAGGVSIIKDGTSTQIFSGANTYLGLTNVNAGTLQLGNALALGNTGLGTTVAAGATLDLGGQQIGVEAVSITGAGDATAAVNGALGNSSATAANLAGILTLTGAGGGTVGGAGNIFLDGQVTGTILTKVFANTVFLTSSANNYTATTITTGVLQVGGAAVGGTASGVLGSGTVTNNATLNFNRSDALTVANTINGTGAVNQNGIGTTALNGPNAYTGLTTVNAGTLRLGNATALGTVAAGTVVVGGATLDLNGQVVGAEAVTLNGAGVGGNGVLVNGGAAASLAGPVTLGSASTIGGTGNITLSGGIVAGAFGLTKVGSNTLFLTSIVNSSNSTTITSGTLQLGLGAAAGALGTGLVNVGTGGTLAVVNIGAAVPNVIANAITNNLGGIGNVVVNSPSVVQLAGNITNGVGGGILQVTQANVGGFTILTGVNTYSGGTTVAAGTLSVGDASASGGANALASAGTGPVTVNLGANLFVDLLNGETFANNVANAGTVSTASNGATTQTISGNITGAGAFNQDPNANGGTTILTGANSYTGTTTVTAGTLQVGNGVIGTISPASAVTVAAAGTLALNLANGGTFANGVVNNGTVNFLVAAPNTNTVSGPISGAGAVTQTAAGTGTTFLSGPNSYNGLTTLNAGVIEVQNNTALGTVAAGTVVNAGATLRLAAGIVVGAEALTLNGNGTGGANALGALTVTAGSAATYGGAILVATNSTINSNGGVLTLTGAINKTGVHLVLNNTAGGPIGGTINVNGAITGGAPFTDDLIANGGTTNLNAANSYVGPTWLINGATVNANVLNALTNSNNANLALRTTLEFEDQLGVTPVVLAAGTGGSILNVNVNQAAQWIDGSFGAVPTSTINLNGNTLNVGTTALPNGSVAPPLAGTPNFAGIIASGTGAPGAGALIKDGNNTQILSGANTYTAATTVNGGTLQAGVATVLVGGVPVSGAFGVNSAVTVATVAPFTPATLELAGFSNTIGSLSDGGTFPATGVVSNTLGGAATLTISGAAGASVAYSGTITDTGATPLALVIGVVNGNAAASQSLSGANTYTGGTTLNSGTLNIDASSVAVGGIPAVNPVLNGPLGTGQLTINGGTIGTGVGSGAFNNNAIGNTVQVNGNFAVTNVVLPLGVLAGPPNTGVGGGFDGVTFTGLVNLNNGGGAPTVITTTSGFLDLTGTVADLFLGVGGGLTLAGGATATYIGSAGVGGIPGIVGQIDASNTYAGLTTVTGGLVVLGKNSGAFAIPGNLQVDAGALVQFDSGAVGAPNAPGLVTTPNQINPTANVLVNGTLDISGINQAINNLTGGGTVRLDDSAFANAGAAGTFTVNSGNFTGAIVGIGAGSQLVKNSTGVLILSGASTYVGNTTINNGSLFVNGSTTSANTIVNPLGLLGGRGFIGGNVLNRGIVNPGTFGNNIATLNIKNNYVQTSSGSLGIQVAGRSQGEIDRLVAGGTATLDGSLRLTNVGGVKLQRGDKLTFLVANGGVNGQFANVVNPFATGKMLSGEVVYYTTSVALQMVQNSYGQFAELRGATPNQRVVARQIDNVLYDSDQTTLVNFLNNQPLSNLLHDFDLIAAEEFQSIYTIGISQANVQTANLSRRMDDIRSGSAGFTAAGLAVSGMMPQYSGNYLMPNNGVAGPEGKMGKELRAPVDNRVGVFFTGFGEFSDIGKTYNASGYDLAAAGFTLGVDYRVNENLAVGMNLGYSRSDASLYGSGNINVDGLKVGLYATYFNRGFYVDASVQAGYNHYDTRRTALQGTATGSTDGTDFNSLLAVGYDWRSGGLTVGPLASVQYTRVGFDSFGEKGSLAPLTYANQSGYSLRTALGAKAAYEIRAGSVIIKPEVRAAWQHEFGDTAFGIQSNFANGGGTTFAVHGAEIGRDSLLLGAGLAVLWNERTSTYVYYDGELGRTNFSANNVSAGVRVDF